MLYTQSILSISWQKKAKQRVKCTKIRFQLQKNKQRQRSKICLFSGASLPPISQPILCTQHRHPSWESNASVSPKMEYKYGILKNLQVHQPLPKKKKNKEEYFAFVHGLAGVKVLVGIQS